MPCMITETWYVCWISVEMLKRMLWSEMPCDVCVVCQCWHSVNAWIYLQNKAMIKILHKSLGFVILFVITSYAAVEVSDVPAADSRFVVHHNQVLGKAYWRNYYFKRSSKYCFMSITYAQVVNSKSDLHWPKY